MSDNTLNRIRQRAFELWEAAGRPEGQDTAHWLQASAEIQGDEKKTAGVVAPPQNLEQRPLDPLSPPPEKSD